MCGRYHLVADPEELLRSCGVDTLRGPDDPFGPRYNIAPSEPPHPPGSRRTSPPRLTRVPIARKDGAAGSAVAEPAVWPLVPLWAKGEVTRYSTANARSETLRESRSYRHAWESGQRCLIPATGFYEWQDAGGRVKQPWSIVPTNEDFFLFGGLWESSRGEDGEEVLSCTIVTVEANPLMREIHNAGKNRHRMPLILPEEAREAWLAGSVDEAGAAIGAFPADEMAATPIGTAVNNPGFDDPKVLEEGSAVHGTRPA